MMSSTALGVEDFELLVLLLKPCNTADSEADLTGVENSLVLALFVENELKFLGEISKLLSDTELFNTWVKFLSCKLCVVS